METNFDNLTTKQLMLLSYLTDKSKDEALLDENGYVTTTQRFMQSETGISRVSITNFLQLFKEKGYIDIDETSSKKNKYKIIIPYDGKVTDGKVTDGKVTDGKVTDGKVTDGKVTDGKVTDGKVTELEGIIIELKYELEKQTKYLQDYINELKSEYKRHIETMHDEYETNEVEVPPLPIIDYDYEYFGERPEWMDETDRVFTSIWQKFSEDKKRYGYIIDFDNTIRPLLSLIPKVHHSDAAKGIQKAIEIIIKEWAGTISGDTTRTTYMKLMRKYGFEYDNSYHAESLDNLQYEKSRNNRNN